MSEFAWRADARTDRGRVRSHNEDAFVNRPDLGLWAVADGMGGHCAGDVASRTVAERLERVREAGSLSTLVNAVEGALLLADAELRALGERPVRRTIGSTVAVLVLHGRHAVCLWAGDSRIYRLREGVLTQLSQDHSVVEELIESGRLSRAQAADHPQANLVTRAVGTADELKLDLEVVELAAHDVFVLCSDGLDKEVTEAEVMAALEACADGRDGRPPSTVLVERALDRGARDNVTVAAVRVQASRSGATPTRHTQRHRTRRDPLGRSQLRLLAERHARGEVDAGEYVRTRTALIDDIVADRCPIRRTPKRTKNRRLWRFPVLTAGSAAVVLLGAIAMARTSSPAPAPPDSVALAGVSDPSRPLPSSPRREPGVTAPDWFRSQPDDAYTVQLFVSPRAGDARAIASRFPDLALKVQQSSTEPYLYRVVYGSFASFEAAAHAGDGLPAPVRLLARPIVRAFRHLNGIEVLR